MENNEKLEGLDLNNFSQKIIPYIEEIASNEGVKKIHARENIVGMGEEILPDIKQLLSAKDRDIKWEATKILEQIGSEKSVPELIRLANDDDFDIRWMAAEGLINVGRNSIVPLLKAILEIKDSTLLRTSAHHVLEVLFTKEEKEKYHSLLIALKSSMATGDIAIFETNKYLEDYYQS
jgi:HEAT repeat protein